MVAIAGRTILRSDERALVGAAGLVFALASAGAAMTAAAADAMFLAEVGPAQLGQAVAASSALLAVVLAVVGGLADRLERRRVLASLAVVSAAAVAGLAVLAVAAPHAAAVAALIGGKQLAAATDLAFWVAIAERIDARKSQRLLPLLAATGGAGAALGAVLVMPIAPHAGPRGVLLVAAALLALAGIAATRLPATRQLAAPSANVGALIARSWRDGARAVRRHPLARHLAIVVGAAGVFGSLAYFALGVAVAGRGGRAADFAELLGGVRGAGQIVTLIVQLAIAPRLLAGLGTGRALLAAPLVALAAALGLVAAPILAIAIATQISARVLDAGIETPAEKLAQTLLPTIVRGRVAGFLDGTAKRAGAVLGGLVAAVLVGAPTAFYIVAAVAAALWLLAARRIARELPALAIEHVVEHDTGSRSRDDAFATAIDDRAVHALLRELDGPRPERAADVLARLHHRTAPPFGGAAREGALAVDRAAGGRRKLDAVAPLVRAALGSSSPAIWRSLVAVLDQPAEAYGTALVDAARAAPARVRELAVRAIGLAGGVAPDAVDPWRDIDADVEPAPELRRAVDPALVLAAEVARRRLARDRDGVLAELADATRAGSDPAAARAAIDELVAEIACGLASPRAPDRALDAARHLQRALRRGRGDPASRVAAFAALARVVVAIREQRSAELALLRADLFELARDRVGVAHHEAPAIVVDSAELAAALRLYGALLEAADVVEPDDVHRLAHALGEPDDDVRGAAEDALAALGAAAVGELIATAAWGRRRARDRAAALLAELPVSPVTIDRLVDAELDVLDETAAALAVIVDPGDVLIARRLEERLREIAYTVLLLVAARQRSRSIARAAVAWRHARGGLERARTLAVIEAALPRALVGRLVEAVDDLTPGDRATALAQAGMAPPARDAVIRAELAGRDRLSRALVLHAIDPAGRSAHRATIAKAAQAEALAASATDLVRRMTEALDETIDEGAHDMPTRVETLIALGRVPLLGALATRQLADVAEHTRWVTAKPGDVVVTAGDPIDALIVVDDGELELGDRRIGKGEVVDELACVAPISAPADLRVVRATRMIRLERLEFEELVDDVPGLAAAVCRALGERARRAEDAGYRSPLASRA